jgi:hypothetical protein
MKHLIAIASLSLLANAAGAADPKPTGGFQIGISTCKPVPETPQSRIVHSKVEVDGVLNQHNGKREHSFGGTGTGTDLDLNWKHEDKLVYTVLSASRDKIPGAGELVGGDRT